MGPYKKGNNSNVKQKSESEK